MPERTARYAWHRLHIGPGPTSLVRGASVFFTPDFALPPVHKVPAVPTVHDLSFLTHPDCHEESLRRYLTRAVRRATTRAAAVVAVSQTTAIALGEMLGVEADRIALVPNGVDSQFTPLDPAEDGSGSLPPFGLPDGYLLAVGTLEPRKNYIRLLQAFALLLRELPSPNAPELAARDARGAERLRPNSGEDSGPGIAEIGRASCRERVLYRV